MQAMPVSCWGMTSGSSITDTPIQRAARAAGGQSALARRVGVQPQSVNLWVRHGRVPAERVLAVEAATGVPRHELRPDLYPEPTAGGHA